MIATEQNVKPMEKKQAESMVTPTRIFWRSFAVLLLFTILLVNFKQQIQNYSSFSIANAMTHIEKSHFISQGLILDLIFFAAIVLFIHLLLAWFITVSCRPFLQSAISESSKSLIWFSIVLLNLTFIISYNSNAFPTSLVSYFRDSIFSSPLAITVFGITSLCLFIRGLYHSAYPKFSIAMGIIVIFTLWITANINNQKQIAPAQLTSKPHIIILGIDGLRPDHLAYKGGDRMLAPFINQLLDKAIIYNNTYSPQGRTYVAWMSILTGQYPVNNGIRFNLAPPERVNKSIPLVKDLTHTGYHTVYAMDERRFNQIDNSYGFSRVIGPKIGAADALISAVADLPYINPLISHPQSKHLFPYLYINRAYGKAYQPNDFNAEVITALVPSQPQFLSVHLCQLHWPYTSKDFIDIDGLAWSGNYSHYMYQAMLKKVDKQVADLFDKLKRQGLLKNAIVYIMSDHGEGFKLDKDQLLTSETIDADTHSWGHGTNVLDQSQANVLLSSLRFQDNQVVNKAEVIQGLFSLVDIMPSIYSALALDLPKINLDGKPLPQTSMHKDSARMVFVESSLPLKSINASFIDDKKVMSETGSNYEVRSNGIANIQVAKYDELVEKKQRSVYYKKWQLALLPNEPKPLIINLTAKTISPVTTAPSDAPWKKMLHSLCTFYQHDYGFDPFSQCQSNTANSQDLIPEPKL